MLNNPATTPNQSDQTVWSEEQQPEQPLILQGRLRLPGTNWFLHWSLIIPVACAVAVVIDYLQGNQSANLILVNIILVLFLSVIIHEAAHAIANARLGMGPGSMTIWIGGGFFIPFNLGNHLFSKDWSERKRFILMSAAGSLANLLMGGLAFVLNEIFPTPFFQVMLRVNLGLGLLNLLPIVGLDGGHILTALISPFFSWNTIYTFYGCTNILMGVLGFVSIFVLDLGQFNPGPWPGLLLGTGFRVLKMLFKGRAAAEAEREKFIRIEAENCGYWFPPDPASSDKEPTSAQ